MESVIYNMDIKTEEISKKVRTLEEEDIPTLEEIEKANKKITKMEKKF